MNKRRYSMGYDPGYGSESCLVLLKHENGVSTVITELQGEAADCLRDVAQGKVCITCGDTAPGSGICWDCYDELQTQDRAPHGLKIQRESVE